MDLAISVSFTPLGVPYSRAAGLTSASFIDLRREPSRISELPEPQRWPMLFDTLTVLNGQSTVFRTTGCEHGASQDEGLAPGCRYWGYVGFCFTNPEWNASALNYYVMFHAFSEYTKDLRLSDLTIRFELRQTMFIDEQWAGWSVDYGFQGLGPNEPAAQARAQKALEALNAFAVIESARLSDASFPSHR